MTEREWLTSTDAQEMFSYLGGHLPHRKIRLLAGALCRRDIGRMADPQLVRAVELCEAYADDPLASGAEMKAAFRQAAEEMEGIRGRAPRNLQARWELLIPDQDDYVWLVGEYETSLWRDADESSRRSLPDLIRDAAGLRSAPVRFEPAWRSAAAVTLARVAYSTHDFGVLPILAHALVEAGCDDSFLLSHCRGGGEHARGCWVVDLVLGFEDIAAPEPDA